METEQETRKLANTWTMRIEQAGETTITGKNQISLPAEAMRLLGWEKGDRLLVTVQRGAMGDTLVLMRQPDDWAEAFAGRLGHLFGTHEENLRYLEGERRSWDEEESDGSA
jgi:AbrB family looped-hinge helix DNA binding protein